MYHTFYILYTPYISIVYINIYIKISLIYTYFYSYVFIRSEVLLEAAFLPLGRGMTIYVIPPHTPTVTELNIVIMYYVYISII